VSVSELEKLRDDKAAGADDLVPRFLSKIKGDISYPLTLENYGGKRSKYQMSGKKQMWCQYSRMEAEEKHPITDQ